MCDRVAIIGQSNSAFTKIIEESLRRQLKSKESSHPVDSLARVK